MDEDQKELAALKELGIQMDIDRARKRMFDEYKELAPMMYYPPFNLTKNREKFTNDLINALAKSNTLTKYNEGLFGDIKNKWQSELAVAQTLSKNKKLSPKEASIAYMKSHKEITEYDFVPKVFL